MQVGELATMDASLEYPFTGENPGGGWCENYALVANDPAAGINLCLYLGRQPFDISVWHEILLLSLPDGRVLVWKSAGRGGSGNGGGGALASFGCVTPGRTWEVRLDGVMWGSTAEALRAEPFHDGPWTRTTLELTFEAAMPPWMLRGDDLEHAQEHLHYEQLGRVNGTVRVGDQSWDFAGTGHRDHSRGPRDFRAIRDHAWVNCLFPGGRAFALYKMRLADGSGSVAVACVYDGATLRPATVTSMPLLAESSDHDHYQLVLEVDGQAHRIDAEIRGAVGTVSYLTPNHMTIGASSDPGACMVVQERGTRFTWDGEIGYGHTQRSTHVHNEGEGRA